MDPLMQQLWEAFKDYVETELMYDNSDISTFEEWVWNHHEINPEITRAWLYA